MKNGEEEDDTRRTRALKASTKDESNDEAEASKDDEESKDEVANLCLLAKEDDLQEENEIRNSSHLLLKLKSYKMYDRQKKRALLATSICFLIGEMDSFECSSLFRKAKDQIFDFLGIKYCLSLIES